VAETPSTNRAGAAALAAAVVAAALVLRAVGAPAEDARAALARVAAEAEAAGRTAVAGQDGWLFLTAELRHLGVGRYWGADAERASRAQRADWRDPLPAILDFHAQLERAGIGLVFVPVPPKGAVVPAALPGLSALPPERLDAADAAFYALLRERGLDVLDLEPALAAAPASPPVFCRTDTHWCGPGLELAAARIAERVKALPFYADVPKEELGSERREVEIEGDLQRMLGGSGGAGAAAREAVSLRFVGRPDGAGGLAPVEPSRGSPLLLLGDSHALVFHAGGDMHARGAGLADQLALELGFAVDLVAVRGSGATPARISLARRAGGLAGKKLVVWCLAARDLTEAAQGWAKVPVVR
jgi:alginate O-acetyltransferase complex protein AlgJ